MATSAIRRIPAIEPTTAIKATSATGRIPTIGPITGVGRLAAARGAGVVRRGAAGGPPGAPEAGQAYLAGQTGEPQADGEARPRRV
ncbi:MAG: hypothetical protein M0Z63_11645, partial [Actinomycetota bacterium]|nr:hypothetical protein [Actinomycetota bacterium]